MSSFTVRRSFAPKNPMKCNQCRTACDRKEGGWHMTQKGEVFLCKNCKPMIQMSVGTPETSPGYLITKQSS